jgi:hypothetical protein
LQGKVWQLIKLDFVEQIKWLVSDKS